MDRLTLERRPVWLYLVAIGLGLGLGSAWPGAAAALSKALWPVLGALLYVTFVQIPLWHLPDALRDGRFMVAVLTGNFLVVPILVGLVLPWLPADPALRLGVALVLLVPYTDWFITFTQLGGGNAARAIAVTPLNLLLQLALLPVYLWLMVGHELEGVLALTNLWPAILLVGLPLALAALTERWIEAAPARARLRDGLAWLTVPLLALVVLLIAAGNPQTVNEAGPLWLPAVGVFVAYVFVAALSALALARLFGLAFDAGRTVAFSLGTRNSFVVLPFALALPEGWALAVVVIVLQTLVELLGMVLYLWWVPRLFPSARPLR
jgi:ACR3 family arsenite efflux pump ArsB